MKPLVKINILLVCVIPLLFLVLAFLSPAFCNTVLPASQLNLTHEEQQWLQEHPLIKVSNEEDWAPYDFAIEGEAKGYSVDIVRLLAKKLGLKIQFINGYSWAELVEEFDKRNIDLMHSMSWSEERNNKYLFSKASIPWSLSYIIRSDDNSIQSPEDFNGKKIAIGRGWATTPVIKKMYPEAEYIEFDSSLNMLRMLSTGKVDVGIDNIHAAQYHMSENLITNLAHGGYLDLKVKGIERLHFASHKDKPELISLFDKAYKSLTTQEKLLLQKKWFSDLNLRKTLSVKNNNLKDNAKNILHFRTVPQLTPNERDYLRKKKKIIMCIDPDWMPFEKFDEHGHHIGISADFFKQFSKDIGVPIEPYKTNTWVESMEAAKARKCDILSLAMATPERKRYMNFTTPYISMALVIVTKSNITFFSDMNMLNNKKVGIVKGYAFSEIIRHKYPQIEVVEVENSRDGLERVASGELYGFIGTITTLSYLMQTHYAGDLKISGKFDEKWELSIGVRNDEPLLLSVFEKAIKSISPEIKQQIFSRYIVVKYEQTLDYMLLLKILAVAVVLFLIIFYHNRKLSKMNQVMESLQAELKEQAHRDPMTELYNRRYFHDIATKILNLSRREYQPISVMILDIDHFKSINDTYGHSAGDAIIKELSHCFVKQIRKSDIVARFGGEEFVILLPNTGLVGAHTIAENLRKHIAQASIPVDQYEINVTISIGIDIVRDTDQSIDDALGRADKALYQAKENGRNKTIIYQEKNA